MRSKNVRGGMRVGGVPLTLLILTAGTLALQAQGPSFTPQPIYPAVEAARPEIRAALLKARREHKRVLLDFGGDWCGDCQVLNIYFHQSPNAELLKRYFVLVDVNIGNEDKNLDIAHHYGVPVKGVPALAVVSPSGQVIFAQNKQFEDMRTMSPQSVTDFLNKWKR